MSDHSKLLTTEAGLEQLRAVASEKTVVAYALQGCNDLAMFVNLPLAEPGPVYGWVGLWRSVEDQVAGAPPHTVIAGGSSTTANELGALLDRSHPLAHRSSQLVGGDTVFVHSTSARNVEVPVRRVSDTTPLLSAWMRAAAR
ncbi:hypothetical protein [Microbacterium sp. BH-3-3-3]|uniref:hypothetical protein n=1 Tax=Microbacterium sp. BH-3-3-3 TaxID=1906742 RepID=UPI00089283F6|nr:hypothetical protein [Microbacterium sp. BH-3-3-3]AOX45350.1 hypothetical protein BJP65_05650 [Microbacterium sp. BH-3-3-3]